MSMRVPGCLDTLAADVCQGEMVTMVAGKRAGSAGDGAEGGKNWTGWGEALHVKAGWVDKTGQRYRLRIGAFMGRAN